MLDRPDSTHNLIADMAALKRAVIDVEKKMQEIVAIKTVASEECKEVQKDIAAIYDVAKQKGLCKRSLKTLIKARELRRKESGLIDSLDELKDEYDAYAEAVEQWNLPL